MLTLQFVPYHMISNLESEERIKKLIAITKENKIVLLEGRLKKDEEAALIKKTMEEIDDDFKGIELSVIYPEDGKKTFFGKTKSLFLRAVLGDRGGFTIIGPASVVKEIKNSPDSIQLLTQEKHSQKRNGSKEIKKRK